MKKLLSMTAAGMAVLVIAGSAFAATPAATTATSSSVKQIAFDHQHKHEGRFANEELLTLLKMDAATLHEELKAGKSLADIAKAQGVDAQKVIDLLVKQAAERLDEAVKAGKLTQAQADEMKANIQEKVKNHVENKGGFGFKKFFFKGKHGGKGVHFADAATIIGIDEQELRTQLKSGKTLAQIAQEKGISKDDLISKLLEKEKERLTQMVDQAWPNKGKDSTADSQKTN